MPQIIQKRENGSIRVLSHNNQPSLAQQHEKDDADINVIIARYQKSGQLPNGSRRPGVYADISSIPDYQTAMQTVVQQESLFMSLPAQVRSKFENDPAQVLKFLADPKNYDEGVNLGLLNPKPAVQPAAPNPNQIQPQTSNNQLPPNQPK